MRETGLVWISALLKIGDPLKPLYIKHGNCTPLNGNELYRRSPPEPLRHDPVGQPVVEHHKVARNHLDVVSTAAKEQASVKGGLATALQQPEDGAPGPGLPAITNPGVIMGFDVLKLQQDGPAAEREPLKGGKVGQEGG